MLPAAAPAIVASAPSSQNCTVCMIWKEPTVPRTSSAPVSSRPFTVTAAAALPAPAR